MRVDKDTEGRIWVCELTAEEAEVLRIFAAQAAEDTTKLEEHCRIARRLAIQLDRELTSDRVVALFEDKTVGKATKSGTRLPRPPRANGQEPRHRHERLLTYLRRGDQIKIAEQVKCTPSTVSAVLNGKQAQNTELAKDIIRIAEEYVARRAKRYVR